MTAQDKSETTKQQIRNRLEHLCAHFPPASFEELVVKIAQTHERDARRTSPGGMEPVDRAGSSCSPETR